MARRAVHRVVCALDCGVAVNPDNVRAQIEGGVGFGLGAVLKSRLTLDGGRVVEGNFDGYEVLRIEEMPQVEVHIVPSTAKPTGVGEPGVPPIARQSPTPGIRRRASVCACCPSTGRRTPEASRRGGLEGCRTSFQASRRLPVG